jgi:hypothetical protein
MYYWHRYGIAGGIAFISVLVGLAIAIALASVGEFALGAVVLLIALSIATPCAIIEGRDRRFAKEQLQLAAVEVPLMCGAAIVEEDD